MQEMHDFDAIMIRSFLRPASFAASLRLSNALFSLAVGVEMLKVTSEGTPTAAISNDDGLESKLR